jgi:DegV family protein with EDD domain
MVADLDLGVAPLTVEMDGRAYTEGEMTPKELYDHLRAGKLPKTSAVNPDGWARLIRPALEKGQDVLVMPFTSALSATYQSAVIAAGELREEFPDRKLMVIDTLCAAMGQGLLVYTAAKLRAEGKSLEETAAWVEAHKRNLCHWVTVEDLMHLKRGGRISAATAVMGTMLSIKPIIRVDDEGKLESFAKARGRKGAIKYLLERMAEQNIQVSSGFVEYLMEQLSGTAEGNAQKLAEKLKEDKGEGFLKKLNSFGVSREDFDKCVDTLEEE